MQIGVQFALRQREVRVSVPSIPRFSIFAQCHAAGMHASFLDIEAGQSIGVIISLGGSGLTPTRLDGVPEIMPALSFTAIVQTSCEDGSVRMLADERRLV